MMRAYYGPHGVLLQPPLPLPGNDAVVLGRPPSRSLMRKLILIISALFVLAPLGACVYQAPLAQGNLLKQEDLDQIEVGMTRNQVRFLLGTPMVDDPFHRDRWDYVYFLKVGRQDASFKRWVTVVFEDDKVAEVIEDQALDPNL